MNIQFEIFDRNNIDKLSETAKSQIILLDQELQDQRWSKKIWNESWDDFAYFLLQVATLENQVVAFSLWTLPPVENVMHLLKVVVQNDLRRHGLAAKLFYQMLKENPSRGVYLEVKASNAHAVAFYQKLGLVIMTKTKNYYGPGQDAYKMFKAALPVE